MNMEEPPINDFTSRDDRPDKDNAPFGNRLKDAGSVLTIFLLFWGIYIVTGCYRRSPFNAHVYLAHSLLHGCFDLIDPPAYFEKVQFAGRSYITYGIGPSLLMLPFVTIYLGA